MKRPTNPADLFRAMVTRQAAEAARPDPKFCRTRGCNQPFGHGQRKKDPTRCTGPHRQPLEVTRSEWHGPLRKVGSDYIAEDRRPAPGRHRSAAAAFGHCPLCAHKRERPALCRCCSGHAKRRAMAKLAKLAAAH